MTDNLIQQFNLQNYKHLKFISIKSNKIRFTLCSKNYITKSIIWPNKNKISIKMFPLDILSDTTNFITDIISGLKHLENYYDKVNKNNNITPITKCIFCKNNTLKGKSKCYKHNYYTDKPDDCIICTNNINNVIKPLDCGHWLHRNCLVKWDNKCPFCRSPVSFTIQELYSLEIIKRKRQQEKIQEEHQQLLNYFETNNSETNNTFYQTDNNENYITISNYDIICIEGYEPYCTDELSVFPGENITISRRSLDGIRYYATNINGQSGWVHYTIIQ